MVGSTRSLQTWPTLNIPQIFPTFLILFIVFVTTDAMSPVTNQSLNATRESNCVGITSERKYYVVDQKTFVKRTLAPIEWQINPNTGNLVVPRYSRERALNEAASMKFIADNTNIPVPELYCVFEDRGAVYLVMEYIKGVRMDSLDPEERKVVEGHVEVHLAEMKKLKSKIWGGPSHIVRCSV